MALDNQHQVNNDAASLNAPLLDTATVETRDVVCVYCVTLSFKFNTSYFYICPTGRVPKGAIAPKSWGSVS